MDVFALRIIRRIMVLKANLRTGNDALIIVEDRNIILKGILKRRIQVVVLVTLLSFRRPVRRMANGIKGNVIIANVLVAIDVFHI